MSDDTTTSGPEAGPEPRTYKDERDPAVCIHGRGLGIDCDQCPVLTRKLPNGDLVTGPGAVVRKPPAGPTLHKIVQSAHTAEHIAALNTLVEHEMNEVVANLRPRIASKIEKAYQAGVIDGFQQGCIAESKANAMYRDDDR